MLCSKACLLGTLNFTCKKFLQDNAFNSYPNFKIDLVSFFFFFEQAEVSFLPIKEKIKVTC